MYTIFFLLYCSCLNRNDIKEDTIGSTPIYNNDVSSRINYFQFFHNINTMNNSIRDGRIFCGNDSIERNCVNLNYVSNRNRKHITCKKSESDVIGTTIYLRHMCSTFDFTNEKKEGTITGKEHLKPDTKFS